MGFTPYALVQVIPEHDEVVFSLCDENIAKYSELDMQTKERGGKLIQVFNPTEKYNKKTTLWVSGNFLYAAGLKIGNSLIAVYEYGKIRVRKLPENAKVTYVSSIKDNHSDREYPKAKLTGEWLAEYGFTPDSVVTVTSEVGVMTFTLRNESIEKYSELVKFARLHKMKIIQVRQILARGKYYTCMVTTGSCVEKSGFVKGESLIAVCEQGQIKLQKLDLFKLGF